MKRYHLRVLAAAALVLLPLQGLPAEGLRLTGVSGQPVAISLELDRPVPETLELLLPELPQGLSVVPVPQVSTRFGFIREIRVEVVARRPGRFILPPLELVLDDESIVTEEILLEIAPTPGGPVPFNLQWQVLSDPVYVGQSVLVLLEITEIDTFTFPESVVYRAPAAGLFEEVSGPGSVRSRDIAGTTLFSIPVAAFIFTPTGTGEVNLPAATVEAQGITVTSAPLVLPVQELPAAVNRSGAVGVFTVYHELDRGELGIGDSAELILEISGVGNISVLDPPEVELEGLEVLEQLDSATVAPDSETLLGYEGVRERRIRLAAEEGASFGVIRIAGFTYLDPRTGQIRTEPGETIPVTLHQTSVDNEGLRDAPVLPLLAVEELVRWRWIPLSRLGWFWWLFVPGPVLFAAYALLSVRGKRRQSRFSVHHAAVFSLVTLVSAAVFPSLNVQRLERAREIAADERYAVAGVLYDLELQDHPWHGGLHYNRGVLAFRSGNEVAARFHVRRAVRLDANHQGFREALEVIEWRYSEGDSIPIARYPRRDIFILILLGVWTAIWITLCFPQSVVRALVVLTLIMGAVVSGGTAIWISRVASEQEGVVRHEVTVRRIPDQTAEPWLQLRPGTPVLVDLSYDQFYLVRAGAGVTGWVPVQSIRR